MEQVMKNKVGGEKLHTRKGFKVSTVVIVAVLLMCSITQITGMELPTMLVSQILMWITAALAVYSGLEYLVKNWKLVNPKQ